jgi:toxin ParE1/3/4
MKTKLLWTPQAREDLLDMYVTIGFDNPSAAERVYTALEEKANLLIGYPRIGVRRPQIAPAARMLVEGAYLLLYEVHPDTDEGVVDEVEIVRVIHGHRDLMRLLPS